jgi:hypothetical protein
MRSGSWLVGVRGDFVCGGGLVIAAEDGPGKLCRIAVRNCSTTRTYPTANEASMSGFAFGGSR